MERARTYEVRTFGCQMNVHDSERLSGSLEAAGYVRADDGDADIVVINTCAVRENADNKLYGTLGHLASTQARARGDADRRRRLPRPEGQVRHPRARALGGRRVRHAQHGLAAGTARARPAQRRGAARDPRVARSVPVHTAEPSRIHPLRLGLDLGGLQQHLHVLHRPGAPRQGEGPAARRHPLRDRDCSSPTASSRSRCWARTSTPTASSSATGSRSASSCVPRARSRASNGVRFTSPHPAAFTDDVIDAMAETPDGHAAAAHAPAVRLRPHPQGDAPLLPVGALPRHPRPRARADAGRGDHDRHHRRLPR